MSGDPAADERRYRALVDSLTNHTPAGPEAIERIESLRSSAKELGRHIIANCPDSRERSLALTHLEETVMWAVKSLVLPRE